MVSLVCSLVLNVNPFMTDIFPEQLTTDQIVDHQQRGLSMRQEWFLSWIINIGTNLHSRNGADHYLLQNGRDFPAG